MVTVAGWSAWVDQRSRATGDLVGRHQIDDVSVVNGSKNETLVFGFLSLRKSKQKGTCCSRIQLNMAAARCNAKRNSSWLDKGFESDSSGKTPKADCSTPESEFPESRRASSKGNEVLKLISLEVYAGESTKRVCT